MEYSFTFSLTEEDYAEFAAYGGWYAPWMKKVKRKFILRSFIYAAIGIATTMIVLEKITPGRRKNPPEIIIPYVVILLLATLVSYYQAPYGIKKRARKTIEETDNKHFLNERELIINEDGLTSISKDTTGQCKWSTILRYAETKEYFYLFPSSIQAYMIPKRLFRSQQEITDFDKFLTQKIPLSSSFRSLNIG